MRRLSDAERVIDHAVSFLNRCVAEGANVVPIDAIMSCLEWIPEDDDITY